MDLVKAVLIGAALIAGILVIPMIIAALWAILIFAGVVGVIWFILQIVKEEPRKPP